MKSMPRITQAHESTTIVKVFGIFLILFLFSIPLLTLAYVGGTGAGPSGPAGDGSGYGGGNDAGSGFGGGSGGNVGGTGAGPSGPAGDGSGYGGGNDAGLDFGNDSDDRASQSNSSRGIFGGLFSRSNSSQGIFSGLSGMFSGLKDMLSGIFAGGNSNPSSTEPPGESGFFPETNSQSDIDLGIADLNIKTDGSSITITGAVVKQNNNCPAAAAPPLCEDDEKLVPGVTSASGCPGPPTCQPKSQASTCPQYQIPLCEDDAVLLERGKDSRGCPTGFYCSSTDDSDTIEFEVKATEGNATVQDWTSADISVSEDASLHFRWDARSYDKCLTTLHPKNYNFSTDVTRTYGNTANSGIELITKDATYSVECLRDSDKNRQTIQVSTY